MGVLTSEVLETFVVDNDDLSKLLNKRTPKRPSPRSTSQDLAVHRVPWPVRWSMQPLHWLLIPLHLFPLSPVTENPVRVDRHRCQELITLLYHVPIIHLYVMTVRDYMLYVLQQTRLISHHGLVLFSLIYAHQDCLTWKQGHISFHRS